MTHQDYINLLTSDNSRDIAIRCSSIQQRAEIATYLRSLGYRVDDDYLTDPDYRITDWPHVIAEEVYDEDTEDTYIYCDVGSPTFSARRIITFEDFFGCEAMSDDIASVEDVI